MARSELRFGLPGRWVVVTLMLLLCAASAAEETTPTHAPEPDSFWIGPVNGPVPATISGGRVMDVQELSLSVKQGGVTLIDVSNAPVRPQGLASQAPWLPVPHAAIPGSTWIPGVGAGQLSESMDRFFREQLRQLSGSDFDHPIVIYCHERCWLSWNAAKRAIQYGYRNVKWFPEGIEGWRAAGLATETVHPTVPDESQQ
jgi:PQQ-dependent catabolism-associated CXXCW motif protein